MKKIIITDLKKYYGSRLILDVDDLALYDGDKVGVVGKNGCGKTTFLEIIYGIMEYDQGLVEVSSKDKLVYISQLGNPTRSHIGGKNASLFNIAHRWNETMSGGEITRYKLAEGFEMEPSIILADEPTSNLDMEGINLIVDNFIDFDGLVVTVSHDRYFLDRVCNRILEIENCKCKLYPGNYTKYLELKDSEKTRQNFQYEEYIKEKERLTNLKRNISQKSKSIPSAPKRMGNSEARLHKMGGQSNKMKLDNFAKSIQSRIDRMEKVEKVKEEKTVRIEIPDSFKIGSKIIMEGKNIDKSFGKNIIFENADFNIYNGKKVALIGPNGSGKTTLIKMIMDNDQVRISKAAKTGYFSQNMDTLDENKSILDNVLADSVHGLEFTRLILARLLIKGDKVNEKLSILSGGERVKVSFAKIILSNINVLILDEPTNYLDIESMEAIERLLSQYDGTVIFVSHDTRFVENIADTILSIENTKIKQYNCGYKEYLSAINKKTDSIINKNNKERKLILEMEQSNLISRLSMDISKEEKEKLEGEYKKILMELKKI